MICIVGKAHFGALTTPTDDPLNIGFDKNIAGHVAGSMRSYLGEENYGNKVKGRYTSSPRGVPHLEVFPNGCSTPEYRFSFLHKKPGEK